MIHYKNISFISGMSTLNKKHRPHHEYKVYSFSKTKAAILSTEEL